MKRFSFQFYYLCRSLPISYQIQWKQGAMGYVAQLEKPQWKPRQCVKILPAEWLKEKKKKNINVSCLKKTTGLSFEQTWITFAQKNFVISLLKMVYKHLIRFFKRSLSHYHLYKKGVALHLDKLFFILGCFETVRVEMTQWFWRRKLFYVNNAFSLQYMQLFYCMIFPLEQTRISFTQGSFVSVEIGPGDL